jgi:hypothetical protein
MVTMFPSALQLLPEFFRTAPLTKLIPSQMDADEVFFFRLGVNLFCGQVRIRLQLCRILRFCG